MSNSPLCLKPTPDGPCCLLGEHERDGKPLCVGTYRKTPVETIREVDFFEVRLVRRITEIVNYAKKVAPEDRKLIVPMLQRSSQMLLALCADLTTETVSEER